MGMTRSFMGPIRAVRNRLVLVRLLADLRPDLERLFAEWLPLDMMRRDLGQVLPTGKCPASFGVSRTSSQSSSDASWAELL